MLMLIKSFSKGRTLLMVLDVYFDKSNGKQVKGSLLLSQDM